MNYKNIKILNECRDLQEIRKLLKKLGIKVTNEKLNELKNIFNRYLVNKKSLNYEQLEEIAGGLNFFVEYTQWTTVKASLHMIKGTEREPGFNIILNNREGISLDEKNLTSVLQGNSIDVTCLFNAHSSQPILDSILLPEAIRDLYSDAIKHINVGDQVVKIFEYGSIWLSSWKVIAPNCTLPGRTRSCSF